MSSLIAFKEIVIRRSFQLGRVLKIFSRGIVPLVVIEVGLFRRKQWYNSHIFGWRKGSPPERLIEDTGTSILSVIL